MTINLKTDVLVAGGGASGVCAAIQAARLGVKVILVEETPWLGGMLTAAGVSAVDGNHRLPSGLWGEFRDKLYEYYGEAEALKTGWVSHTLFEPHVGDRILKKMVDYEANIFVYYGYWIIRAIKDDNTIRGAEFINEEGDILSIYAHISIDATEYGDLLALAGCEFNLGRESKFDTNESFAPEIADEFIQDMTYVAILKDYGNASDHTIQKPVDYDPAQFKNMCRELADAPGDDFVHCERMLNYGRLPSNKFMLNWPINGNDYYLNYVEMNHEQRKTAFQAAKNFTLCCIYHIQAQLGIKNLTLADDEFATSDKLPYIPYIRESRRLKGIETLKVQDIIAPYDALAGAKYKNGIAVGDYPLDHHHAKAPVKITESFPDIPAFNVPYGCLIPKNIDGLVVAEKSISVTHIVNGCTRLQPVVMQIGQAAGASAAISVQEKIVPRDVNIRKLQQILLDANVWLMPFVDISPNDGAFQAVQRIGLSGVLKGDLIPNTWENQMKFYPDNGLTIEDVVEAFNVLINKKINIVRGESEYLTRAETASLIWELIGRPNPQSMIQNFQDVPQELDAYYAIQYFHERGWLKSIVNRTLFYPHKKIIRKEFAFLIDEIFDPFAQLS